MDTIEASWADPLEMALQRELQRGERVLWKGRLLPRLNIAAFAIWAFAIPWTAFALFWTAMAYVGVNSMEPEDGGLIAYAFPLFGLPFILVGLGMMAGPFMPLFFARKTMFAITNQRLIQIRLGYRLVTKSVDGRSIGSVERSERRDGSGTLKIVAEKYTDSDGDAHTEHFVIGEVANVIEAESELRYMREQLARGDRTALER